MPRPLLSQQALSLTYTRLCQVLAIIWLAAHAEARDLAHSLDWVPLAELTKTQREALSPGSCGAYIAPLRTDTDATVNPDKAPTRAEAQSSTVTEFGDNNKRVVLIDDVVITQGFRRIKGQRAVLDEAASTLIMEGELEIREPGLLILGDKVKTQKIAGTLQVEGTHYVVHQANLRGSAAEINKTAEDDLELKQANLTTCPPQNNTWEIKGSRIYLDQSSRQGHAYHVRLIVHGAPIFYSPYLRFPLGDERLTGFLAPTITREDDRVNFSLPFYFNLAPNYDLLYTYHFVQRNGDLHQANFRHLSQYFFHNIDGAYLKDDKGELNQDQIDNIDGGSTVEEEEPFKGNNRWIFHLNQVGGEGRPWSTRINYTETSDVNFFEDFDTYTGALDEDNYVKQEILTGYTLPHWNFGLDAIRYQTFNEQLSTPYEQLPNLTINGSYNWGKWQLDLNNEWIEWDIDQNDSDNPKLTGTRLFHDYQLNFAYEPEWGFFKPGIKLKHLSYRLEDNGNFVDGVDRTPSLTVPQAVIDMGIYLEREGGGYLQTLEPRLFYVYSDYEDHSDLFDLTTDAQDIKFDTSELTFSYSQLFRDSRFSGNDRLEDANRLSIGLTTRFLGSKSGREWFSASIGQIMHFDDRRVTLDGEPLTEPRSLIAGQFSSNPISDLRITGDLLYNEFDSRLDQGNFKIRFQNRNAHLFELGYRFTNADDKVDVIEQVNSAWIAPLGHERFHWILFNQYNTRRNRELETLTALEYNSCCYRLRVGYRSEIGPAAINTVEEDLVDYDYSVFIDFHFKGLGGTGKQLDSLLDESIDGYQDWQAIFHQ